MANKLPKQGSQPGRIPERQLSAEKSYTGPLPEPRDLEYYELTVPGAGKTILDMAVKEQNARHELQKMAAENAIKHGRELNQIPKRGQIFAFLSVLVVAGLCFSMAYSGDSDNATKLGIAVMIGLAAVFLGAKWSTKTSTK